MDRSDSKGHVLNKDSDWLIFKSFVTGYSRREGAYGILTGTEVRPVPNPLHEPAQAAAALPALIASQRIWDMTSSKIWFYIFTFTGYEYQSLLTTDDAITCLDEISWGFRRQERVIHQYCSQKCYIINITRHINRQICGRPDYEDSDFIVVDPSYNNS